MHLDKIYQVTSSLPISNTDGTETDYIGCIATVMHVLPKSLAVRFYEGMPVLVPKDKFLNSVKEIKSIQMNYHEVYEVSLFLNTVFVTRFRIISFEGEDIEEKAKDTALRLFKLKYGANYNTINTNFINSIGEKTMAKKQEQPEKTDETGVVLFEEKAKQVSLPEIPKTFTLGGIEVSIEKINKEVEEVKKLSLKDKTDKATYLKIKKKAGELMKTRTSTKNFREAVAKPVNAWLKTLKKNIQDDVEAAVKPGEDHCAAQMKIYEDWEAEQERLEEERIEKLIQSRRELLQAIGGDMNVASFSWTFSHSGDLIENEDLGNYGDEEFAELYERLSASFKSHEESELKKQEEAANAKKLVSSTRKQMLKLMQYAEENGVFTKNGHVITDAEINSSDEATWMQLMMDHNTPKASAPSVFQVPQTNPPVQSEVPPPVQSFPSAGGFFNPFAVKNQEKQAPQAEPTETKPVTLTCEDAIDVLFKESQFFSFPLNNTTVKVFPANREPDLSHGEEIVFIGEFSDTRGQATGLSFIIHKNN